MPSYITFVTFLHYYYGAFPQSFNVTTADVKWSDI